MVYKYVQYKYRQMYSPFTVEDEKEKLGFITQNKIYLLKGVVKWNKPL